ncbi:hypothetical protein D9V96_006830 [Zobellia laminariae]|uniref:hypothetical protein n=1 Tax=Zobellia laminariae TaxID=248906 RepID=UPI0012D92148|nr:hypothetical protein [Zobellia laminariae]MUH39379.1 hypothetical protein [Zobellia laminariae]WKX78094.1 hypothetical protein Q5W13_09330 [Zobellia laminariae]
MNKTLTIIIVIAAIALIAYNVTMIDFQNPFSGDSTIALIGIVASLCAIMLILIFRTSKKIQKKVEQRN